MLRRMGLRPERWLEELLSIMAKNLPGRFVALRVAFATAVPGAASRITPRKTRQSAIGAQSATRRPPPGAANDERAPPLVAVARRGVEVPLDHFARVQI